MNLSGNPCVDRIAFLFVDDVIWVYNLDFQYLDTRNKFKLQNDQSECHLYESTLRIALYVQR